jgi:hypothetical protein
MQYKSHGAFTMRPKSIGNEFFNPMRKQPMQAQKGLYQQFAELGKEGGLVGET